MKAHSNLLMLNLYLLTTYVLSLLLRRSQTKKKLIKFIQWIWCNKRNQRILRNSHYKRYIFFDKLNMKIVHRVYFTVLKLFDLLKYCWCCNIVPFQLETYWVKIIFKDFPRLVRGNLWKGQRHLVKALG